jgi:hypothetical protein
MTAKQCRVFVTVQVGGFVEFPRESALHLLQVRVANGAISGDYPFSEFVNVFSSGENVTFCNIHQFSGPTQTSLYCGKRELTSLDHFANGVGNAIRGWTRSFWSPNHFARLGDFCIANGTIHIIVGGRLKIPPLRLSKGFALAVRPIAPDELDSPAGLPANMSVYNWPVVFVAAAPIELWRQLTDVLFPIWAIHATSNSRHAITAMLMRADVQKHLVPAIARMMPILEVPSAGCFADGEFPRAPGGASLGATTAATFADHLRWMAADQGLLREFCAEMVNGVTAERYRIVIDRYGQFLHPIIGRMFPEADAALLPETDDIALAAKKVAASHVFVACHPSAVILAMFAHGAVVEVSPDGLACTAFGAMWAPAGGADYFSVGSGKCHCQPENLSCYLDAQMVWHAVDEDALRHAISEGFKSPLSRP